MTIMSLAFDLKTVEHAQDGDAVFTRTTKRLREVASCVAFWTDQSWEVQELPMITSLHVIGSRMTPFSYSSPVLRPTPVDDAWVERAQENDATAEVLVIREPMLPPNTPLTSEFVNSWLENIMSGRMLVAMREVPVIVGPDLPEDLGGIDPQGPHSSKEWARWATWGIVPEEESGSVVRPR